MVTVPPTDHEARIDERLAQAEAALVACTPTRCPHCGSGEVVFMFDPDMLLWLCCDCQRVFPERD
jgi:transposase-like protein